MALVFSRSKNNVNLIESAFLKNEATCVCVTMRKYFMSQISRIVNTFGTLKAKITEKFNGL